MGTIAEAYKNTALDALPSTVYVALFVGEPGNGGTECTGTGYARIAATMAAASAGARTNSSGPHVFTAGAGGWQAGVNWSALYSASSGGALITKDALSATRDMSIEGATLTIAAGDIDITLTDA